MNQGFPDILVGDRHAVDDHRDATHQLLTTTPDSSTKSTEFDRSRPFRRPWLRRSSAEPTGTAARSEQSPLWPRFGPSNSVDIDGRLVPIG
jgi:hypothetical protein